MRQKGQTLVEFAFVVPIVVFLFLSILYFGMMFMEYLHYSNAARDAARDISVLQHWDSSSDISNRTEAVKRINAENFTESDLFKKRYAPITKLYSSKWQATLLNSTGTKASDEDSAVDVKVTIRLTRDAPLFLGSFHILPKELNTIEYIMKLEKKTNE